MPWESVLRETETEQHPVYRATSAIRRGDTATAIAVLTALYEGNLIRGEDDTTLAKEANQAVEQFGELLRSGLNSKCTMRENARKD